MKRVLLVGIVALAPGLLAAGHAQETAKDTVKIGDMITIENAALAKDPKNNWLGALPTTFLIPASGGKLPTR